jgi:hypothetical protein
LLKEKAYMARSCLVRRIYDKMMCFALYFYVALYKESLTSANWIQWISPIKQSKRKEDPTTKQDKVKIITLMQEDDGIDVW